MIAAGIVFDVQTLFKFGLYEFDDEWFDVFDMPDIDATKRIVKGDIIYFLHINNISENVPLIIINTSGSDNVFKYNELRKSVFSRIVTIAQSFFANSVNIPFGWHGHHEGSTASIYAATKAVGRMARLYYDSNPAGTNDLFVFAVKDEVVKYSALDRYDGLYLSARTHFVDALVEPFSERKPIKAGITLGRLVTDESVLGSSLADIYKVKLTSEQRSFVDMPYDGPVRLRGAAGTGKTLSLVVKFLYDGIKFEQSAKSRRFCFLTHSSSTVNSVNRMCANLDTAGLTMGLGAHVRIQIRTLYDLAFEYLRFDLNQLRPLSIDGREGRMLQAELIGTILREAAADKIFRARFSDVSPELREAWLDGAERRTRFVADLMNEFASVLDADGVWANTEKGDKYVKGTFGYRPVYLMKLPTERDRRFVLEIHKQYRQHLSDMNTLSVDQMVADFNSFLSGNAWDRLRDKKGFDAIFVDELHLFTATEREILHKLIKNWAANRDGDVKKPAIFMAYDVKQSPRDSFTQISTDTALFSATSQLQKADQVKLSRVFRYTPQIGNFLLDLDAMFPAMNMADEWEDLSIDSQVSAGEVPSLSIFRYQKDLVKEVFGAAISDAKKLGARKVAVLCVNEGLFDQYCKIVAGRFSDSVVQITSRDATPDLRHAGKKVVLSMPEFVAGLQFEVVYLLNIDADDFPTDLSVGERRRLISNVYLGASRAEKVLRVVASEDRGGPASILDMAIKNKSIARPEKFDQFL